MSVLVNLKESVTLKHGSSLAIYAAANSTPILSITATAADKRSVSEFSGDSSAGLLEEGTEVFLTLNHGGLLGNFLIVLGKGVLELKPL